MSAHANRPQRLARRNAVNSDGQSQAATGTGAPLCLFLAAFAPLLAVLLALVISAAPASAAVTRNYTGVAFGPDGTGGAASFGIIEGVATDGAGNVYVLDTGDGGAVYKFDASGTPVPFAGLAGKNAIEGVGGSPGAENQIAIAPAGSPAGTAGDIYVANNQTVEVYSAEGLPLGSFGEGETCGVAVGGTGHVFVGTYPETISEYVPSNNPPVNTDRVSTATVPIGLCNVAVDSGGNLYATNYAGEQIAKLAGIGDSSPIEITPGAPTINTAGTELLANRGESVAVYDAAASVIETFGTGELVESRGAALTIAGDRAYVGDNGSHKVKIFGEPVVLPTPVTGPATGPTPVGASLEGTVDPAGLAVETCTFEYGETSAYGQTADCQDPDAAELGTGSGPVAVHAPVADLKGSTEYHYRLVAGNANGSSAGGDQTFTTPPAAITRAATDVESATATLNGEAFVGTTPPSSCLFEYGLAENVAFEATADCVPAAADLPTDSAYHPVSAHLTALQSNSRYRFRLTTGGSAGIAHGATMFLETVGEPRITEIQARDASQSGVTLTAKIDPRGFDTHYFLEWGPTTAYGNRIPVSGEPEVPGAGPETVSTTLSGLAGASTYHYRLSATNTSGTAITSDHEFETLDNCGLPSQRCFELVSPPEAGPFAQPGTAAGRADLHYQAGGPPGSILYSIQNGLPAASAGADVLYRGERGPDGWSTEQYGPPVKERPTNGFAFASTTLGVSHNLQCSVLESSQLLTNDPGTRLARENGGENLYRRAPDGSYTAITSRPPNNSKAEPAFALIGMSADCSKVFFTAQYEYPGTVRAGSSTLYEWDEGALRNVSAVPDGSGETVVPASPGGNSGEDLVNAVSEDGSRTYFVAERLAAPNPAEIGTPGVFVRESGSVTRDISVSKTSTPDLGADYKYATPDGSKVFFTANAGLTTSGSTEGTDLYVYDLETNTLNDISANEKEHGAAVVQFLGASTDGSHAYFAARGELLADRGSSYAENIANGTVSIYGAFGGHVEYVGRANDNDLNNGLGVDRTESWKARVSPDGRFLVWQTAANVTGYDSGGEKAKEVYLYEAGPQSEGAVCLSCRPDGKPSISSDPVNGFAQKPLFSGDEERNPLHMPVNLVVRNGIPHVFFKMRDALAPGAVEGQQSLYEWAHDQVFLIRSEPAGLVPAESAGNANLEGTVEFRGASDDGSDLYFVSREPLTWEDGDERASLYDARIGGGFPQPPAPPAPCQADVEGSCQGTAAGGQLTPGAASKTFSGPGNPKHKKKHHKKKHHKKKHHKKKHHKKKHHGKRRPSSEHAGHGNDRGTK